jgi:hypothetical protein
MEEIKNNSEDIGDICESLSYEQSYRIEYPSRTYCLLGIVVKVNCKYHSDDVDKLGLHYCKRGMKEGGDVDGKETDNPV